MHWWGEEGRFIYDYFFFGKIEEKKKFTNQKMYSIKITKVT